MPIQSDYTDEQIETLLAEIIEVFSRHQTTTQLSLMALGNMATHLINHQIAPAHRQKMAASFAQALLKSIHTERAH